MLALWATALVAGAAPAAEVFRVVESELLPTNPISSDDYPPASLRAEETGRVTYVVTIDVDGVPRDCRVTGSSGFPRLDERSCVVALRSRYMPATLDGKPVAARRTSSINWQIPTYNQPSLIPLRGAVPGD